MWAFGAISGFAAPLDQPSLSRGERSPNTTTAATNTSALGIRFSEHSTRELAHVVAGETIDVGAGPRAIMTANVDHVVQLRRRGRFRDAYGWAWALTADGMPVYLYAKLRGVSILERVTGCALADQVLKKLSPERHRCFFIVGTEALGDALERMLVRHGFSRESVEICVPPFGFEADRAYSNALARRVHAHRTTHLFVALGAPKSEEWAYEQRECIGDCYVLCVGMALDYLVGARRRAPVWMQNGGLEWLWRFAHEPVRLFPRYFVASWGFLAAVRRDLSRS